MATYEQYLEAKKFRTQMLWLGVLTLPIGIGFAMLMIYSGMDSMIKKYEREHKVKKQDSNCTIPDVVVSYCTCKYPLGSFCCHKCDKYIKK